MIVTFLVSSKNFFFKIKEKKRKGKVKIVNCSSEEIRRPVCVGWVKAYLKKAFV